MFKNEVSILKKENKLQANKLQAADSDTIEWITRGLSVFKVNSYDAEVIRRDLIGMSQELRLRDTSLKESIGDNLGGFIQEVIKNSNGPSYREIFLSFIEKLSLYMLGVLIISSFFLYGGFQWEVTPVILLFYIGFASITFIIEGIITPSFITKKGLMKMIPSLFAMLLILALVYITASLNDPNSIKVINVSYLIIISAITYIISKYFYTKHIHKLAKDKRNFIQDLI